MAKIAVLNDTPEVVVLLSRFLTQGHHEFLERVGTSDFVMATLIDFQPDLILIPMYRDPALIGQQFTDYQTDIQGTEILVKVSEEPRLAGVPVIVFGFSTTDREMPERFRKRARVDHFLTFPEGLQELNPLISSLVGPALGGRRDIDKVRAEGRRQP